jgi:8-oxo-dGTP pyrophosphatase MutT (NUDIX family)
MENKERVLFAKDNLEFIEREGRTGVKADFSNVVVLPYISDDNGLPLLIGVLKEYNVFREEGYSISPITGTAEDEDPDFLETAKRELKEESGFDVPDDSRWSYLGNVTSSKFVDHEQPCYAVDVTDIERGTPQTDGSEQELKSEFFFIPANDVVKCKDVFIPALFLKLFKYVLGIDLHIQRDGVFNPKGFNISI